MAYSPNFTDWKSLTISDLLVAYRKAKADCFFENSFPTAVRFAEFEEDLIENLESLLGLLHAGRFQDHDHLLGDCRLVPKKLSITTKSENGHAHFSDPNRSFDQMRNASTLVPEFRIVGDFPVETHIISALWINLIGRKFDACLGDSCFGSRLRRVRSEEELDEDAPRPFHITAHTSFEAYFQPYQRWRREGLNAIRHELDQKRRVIAVSLDLKSYYHNVDPSFFAKDDFQELVGLTGAEALKEAEKEFTSQLAGLLTAWSRRAKEFAEQLGDIPLNSSFFGGLVIGLTATRIISNVLLHRWDVLVKERLTPIYYGRYVDDMFLVLHDPGTIDGIDAFMQLLSSRFGEKILHEGEEKGIWEIQLGSEVQGNSRLQLQAAKQRLFVLEGKGGSDLLDSIEQEITNLSSERRLMPSPDQLDQSTAARVLTATRNASDQADTLRRADGLTIRRLGWSTQLRQVETLARDLPARSWERSRAEFYEFAYQHILRPDRIFEHYSYLPRLLGFAIALNEWVHADRIVNHSMKALENLESACLSKEVMINGANATGNARLWQFARSSLTWAFIDAAAKSYPPALLFSGKQTRRIQKLAQLFMAQLWQELHTLEELVHFDLNSGNFHKKAPLLAVSDLARTPYHRLLEDSEADGLLKLFNKRQEAKLLKRFEDAKLLDVGALKEFLKVTKKARLSPGVVRSRVTEGYRPYLFPTRPYSPSKIAELDPRCVGLGAERLDLLPQDLWARHVRAIRGVWVKPVLVQEDGQPVQSKRRPQSRTEVRIGNGSRDRVVVAITNLLTTDASWAASAASRPDLSLARYRRISQLVNQAINLEPRPDYFILPELSLPHRWIDSIASKLIASGISLIAGIEYSHGEKGNIHSEACMELVDDRLGFPASVRIYQPKLLPAASEDETLVSRFGLAWTAFGKLRKPIYRHNGFYFGVLMCSELQNTKARVAFQGDVDALVTLSWNRDLETFAALIESSALDVHAYTILVNNRRYGDSRVRSPAKELFRRDLARLRGGQNDFCVAVELDVALLRAFQSRAKRWPKDNDPFKPVPEEFKISDERRTKPPS